VERRCAELGRRGREACGGAAPACQILAGDEARVSCVTRGISRSAAAMLRRACSFLLTPEHGVVTALGLVLPDHVRLREGPRHRHAACMRRGIQHKEEGILVRAAVRHSCAEWGQRIDSVSERQDIGLICRLSLLPTTRFKSYCVTLNCWGVVLLMGWLAQPQRLSATGRVFSPCGRWTGQQL